MRGQKLFNLILICLILIFAGLSLSLLGPFYPGKALSKGVSVTQSGMVFASVFITAIIITPICGSYMKAWGGAWVFFIGGAFICSVGNIFFGYLDRTDDPVLFLILSFAIRNLIAVGEAGMLSSAYILAAKQGQKHHEGRLIAIAESSFGMGMMFGPTVGGFLYEVGGFSLPFWLTGYLMLVVSVAATLLVKPTYDPYGYENMESFREVTWKELLSTNGIPVSIFALTFAGTAWSWYSASLEPFLATTFNLTSSQTGLVFITFSMVYTIATPLTGLLMDQGMGGLTTLFLGNLFIAISYIFVGPIPHLQFLGENLWLSAVAIGMNGLGCAITFLGSLVYMGKCVMECLPNTERTKGMVSSLWVVSYSSGGYIGSFLGGFCYDQVGFQMGSLIEACVMGSTVLVLLGYIYWRKRKEMWESRESIFHPKDVEAAEDDKMWDEVTPLISHTIRRDYRTSEDRQHDR